MPRVACIRPNSSNVVAFISSCMAFGCSGIVIFAFGALRVLKPNVEVSLTRTSPSHLVIVLPAALQLPLAAKLVP